MINDNIKEFNYIKIFVIVDVIQNNNKLHFPQHNYVSERRRMFFI